MGFAAVSGSSKLLKSLSDSQYPWSKYCTVGGTADVEADMSMAAVENAALSNRLASGVYLLTAVQLASGLRSGFSTGATTLAGVSSAIIETSTAVQPSAHLQIINSGCSEDQPHMGIQLPTPTSSSSSSSSSSVVVAVVVNVVAVVVVVVFVTIAAVVVVIIIIAIVIVAVLALLCVVVLALLCVAVLARVSCALNSLEPSGTHRTLWNNN